MQYATWRVPATPWGAVWWWLRVRCRDRARDALRRPPAEDPALVGARVAVSAAGAGVLRHMREGETGVVSGSEVAGRQRLYRVVFPRHDVRTPLPNPHFEVLR